MSAPLRVERGYVSASVAARLLKVSRQRVHQLLVKGKLEGAVIMDCGGGREAWCIPRKSVKERIAKIGKGQS